MSLSNLQPMAATDVVDKQKCVLHPELEKHTFFCSKLKQKTLGTIFKIELTYSLNTTATLNHCFQRKLVI